MKYLKSLLILIVVIAVVEAGMFALQKPSFEPEEMEETLLVSQEGMDRANEYQNLAKLRPMYIDFPIYKDIMDLMTFIKTYYLAIPSENTDLSGRISTFENNNDTFTTTNVCGVEVHKRFDENNTIVEQYTYTPNFEEYQTCFESFIPTYQLDRKYYYNPREHQEPYPKFQYATTEHFFDIGDEVRNYYTLPWGMNVFQLQQSTPLSMIIEEDAKLCIRFENLTCYTHEEYNLQDRRRLFSNLYKYYETLFKQLDEMQHNEHDPNPRMIQYFHKHNTIIITHPKTTTNQILINHEEFNTDSYEHLTVIENISLELGKEHTVQFNNYTHSFTPKQRTLQIKEFGLFQNAFALSLGTLEEDIRVTNIALHLPDGKTCEQSKNATLHPRKSNDRNEYKLLNIPCQAPIADYVKTHLEIQYQQENTLKTANADLIMRTQGDITV